MIILEYDEGSPGDELLWDLIHPAIARVSRSRFEAGHYADSAEAAFKEVNQTVNRILRSVTGKELDGAPLMYEAFSPKQPVIRIGDLSTESGRNEQQGYMQIFAGAMIGIRNPKAHENVVIDRSMAGHLLALASLLMMKLDEHAELAGKSGVPADADGERGGD